MKKFISIFALCVICLLFTVGCGETKYDSFTVTLEKTSIECTVEDSFSVNYTVVESIPQTDIKLVYDETILECSINNGTISAKALKVGETTINLSVNGCATAYDIKVKVNEKPIMIGDVTLNSVPTEMVEGEEFTITYNSSVEVSAKWTSSDETKASVVDGKVTAKFMGNVTISLELTTKDDKYTKDFNIKINSNDTTVPVFSLEEGYEENIKLNWGTEFDPLAGVKATDNHDGDITSSIQVTNTVDTKVYGTYTVTYSVTDMSGNSATFTRNVEVKWLYGVKFIGHAGSFYGAQNSEEACIYALKELHYQALECDLQRTSDGVFVCCHNSTMTTTTGKTVTIGTTKFKTLNNYTFVETRGSDTDLVDIARTKYEFKVLTLERYLELCKEYNAVAIIELKGCNNITQEDQSGMPALMKLIESKGMRGQVIFLASAYNCLIWTRNNGYSDIPCQYLMSTCDSEACYKRTIQYNFDISICVTYGNYTDKFTDEEREAYKQNWIKRYMDAGCEVSVWTFTQYCDYAQVQEWIDFGVDYVTCDWQEMDKLDLSKAGTSEEFTVTFLDSDNTVLRTSIVKSGKAAVAPTANAKAGYEFDKWSEDITNVTSDMTVTAQYKEIEYNINYDLNLYVESEGTKYYMTRANVTAPTDGLTYSIGREVTLGTPVTTLTFGGWYTNPECTGEAVTKVEAGQTGDKTFYAKWEALDFTKYISNITYELNEGTNNEGNANTYTEGITTALLEPTKKGYDFIGWTLTNDSTDYITEISDRQSGDITLYANYELHAYNITYNLNGGKWDLNPQINGDASGTINTNANTSLDYWTYYSSKVWIYANTASQAKFSERIYLKLVANNVYSFVGFVVSGTICPYQTSEYDIFIQISDGNTTAYNAAKNICELLDEGDVAFITGDISTGNTTVTFYKKTNVTGLTVDNYITTYTISNTAITLPVPTYEGKTFKGWSLSSDLTNPTLTIPADTAEDLVLYAVYE